MISNSKERRAWAIVAVGALLSISAVTGALDTFSLRSLYFLPVIFVSITGRRPWIVATAAVSAALSILAALPAHAAGPYLAVAAEFTAWTAAGLFLAAVFRDRSSSGEQTMQREVAMRKAAERQFEVLIENSPLAVLLLDEGGHILAANAAAGRLFLVDHHSLTGELIAPFVPVLDFVCREQRTARGVMEARARRRNGEAFAGWLWFSGYPTADGNRVAVMLADATEDVREQHEQHLRETLSGSAVLVGAFAHEIRNVSAALRLSHARLGRRTEIQSDPDYQAMAALLESLSHLASTELRQTAKVEIPATPLGEALSDLRMIVSPWLEESGVTVTWPGDEQMPVVRAEPHVLIQIFLNLMKNSLRALEHSPRKRMEIAIESGQSRVCLVFSDSGPGIAEPSRLFYPFQSGAEASGLGLYVSRALVRAFGGELRHESRGDGSCFVVELESAIGVYGKSVGNSSRTAAG